MKLHMNKIMMIIVLCPVTIAWGQPLSENEMKARIAQGRDEAARLEWERQLEQERFEASQQQEHYSRPQYIRYRRPR